MKITAMREARKRLGIPESEPLDRDFVPMLIDREGGWVDDNWVMVSSVFVSWAIDQPELLVPGALEYFQVIANSHITGAVGGVGSPRHKHAMIAWQRFTSSTSSEAAAIKAAKAVIERLVAKWPSSRMGIIEPALSPEEHAKRRTAYGADFFDPLEKNVIRDLDQIISNWGEQMQIVAVIAIIHHRGKTRAGLVLLQARTTSDTPCESGRRIRVLDPDEHMEYWREFPESYNVDPAIPTLPEMYFALGNRDNALLYSCLARRDRKVAPVRNKKFARMVEDELLKIGVIKLADEKTPDAGDGTSPGRPI